jgi:hypothetical protein
VHDAEPTQEPADRIYAVIRHAKEVRLCRLQSPPCSQPASARSMIPGAESADAVLQTAQRSQYGPGAVAFEFAQVSSGLQCVNLVIIRCGSIMCIALTV